MTQKEKDDLCDGINSQNIVRQYETMDERRNTNSSSLKRQLTSQSINEAYKDEGETSEGFTHSFNNKNHHKRHNNNNNEIRFNSTSRIYTNSNSNHYVQTSKQLSQRNRNMTTNIENINNRTEISLDQHSEATSPRVSQQALNYAAETHLQPIKIQCEPKFVEQKAAVKFIQQFFKEIESDFRKQNPTYTRPLGFDIWWIDKGGDIQGISKQLDVYIYLCKSERYPKEINNTKIDPVPPKHLPPQRSTIIKWVRYEISNDEIKAELDQKFTSIYAIEDITGSRNTKNRHVRVDFADGNDYQRILNEGTVSIYGQLYPIDEYLPAPRLLLCSKCNSPGHVKKSCTVSQYDRCRRCGGNRQNGNHETCLIKCHHCEGNHKSTDYICPIIQQYRRQVIVELRNRPELLPADVQLFIPSDYRDHLNRGKIIQNKNTQYQQHSRLNSHHHMVTSQQNFHDDNYWPSLPSPSRLLANTTSTMNNDLNETIKSLGEELNKLKNNYREEEKRLEEKYQNHLSSMKQCWLIMQQQIETQSAMIKAIHSSVNSCMFYTCASIMESFKLIMNKMKNDSNANEFDSFLSSIQQQQLMLIDQKSSYVSHITELEQIERKQREALDYALKSIIQPSNV